MNTNIFQKAMFAVAAAAITTVSFSTVAKAENRVTRTAVVSYSDLDLTSADGKATFEGRIRGAVKKVCGNFNAKDLNDTLDHGQCMTEAKASARKASVTILAAAEAGDPVEMAMVVSN